MKNAIKLYTTFIPTKILKWIVYLVYPLSLMMMSATFGRNYLFYGYIIMPLIFWVELMLNNLMFKEITTKAPVRIEYMHTSDKGVHLLFDVLKVDVIRRFVTVCAIGMMPVIYTKLFHPDSIAPNPYVVYGETISETLSSLYYLLATLLLAIIIEIDLWIARNAKSGIAIFFLICFMGYMACVVLGIMLGVMVSWLGEKWYFVAVVISIVVYALVVTFSYKNIMKSEERKFFD